MKNRLFDKNEYKKLFSKKGMLRKIASYGIKGALVTAALLIIVYLLLIPRPEIELNVSGAFSYEGEKSIENFSFNVDTGEFNIVTDNGHKWNSEISGEKAEEDEIARGINRIMMQSQLAIRYADEDSRIYIGTSYINALSGGDIPLDAKKEGNRVLAEYNFLTGSREDGLYISIPVEYEFKDDSLKVTVLTDQIKENKEYKLIEISLLPYFGAASADEDGYILIPDGSGALIDFGDTKTHNQQWYEFVYGRDPALSTSFKSGAKEMVRLPVLGMKKSDSAFLAIVEEGDALCSITVNTAEYNSSMNYAFFSYRYREFDTIVLSEMGWNERRIPYVSGTSNSNLPFTVRYIFLNGEDADYSGMALAHRNYLTQKYDLEEKEKLDYVPFFIDAYMSIRRVQPVLGLPRDTTVPLTTFEELSAMVDTFSRGGIDEVIVKINGWTDGGPFYKPPDKVSFENSIGGFRGFRRMANIYEDNEHISFFPAVDLINGYRDGNRFISILQGNRNITGALSRQSNFLMSTGRRNPRQASWHLITPSYSYGLMGEFLDSYDRVTDLGINAIALDGYGEKIYSDNYNSFLNSIASRTPMDRQSVRYLWQEIMRKSSVSAGKVMVTGGNQYAIPFADYIIGVPMNSSRLKISSRDVPYYQILTSGLVDTASTPVNFSIDNDEFYLRCLETGTFPMYTFFARESSMVKNTRLNHLYNGEYRLWTDFALEKYEEYNEAYSMIMNSKIIKHERTTDNKSLTVYENGVAIEIDYNTKTFEIYEGWED